MAVLSKLPYSLSVLPPSNQATQGVCSTFACATVVTGQWVSCGPLPPWRLTVPLPERERLPSDGPPPGGGGGALSRSTGNWGQKVFGTLALWHFCFSPPISKTICAVGVQRCDSVIESDSSG